MPRVSNMLDLINELESPYISVNQNRCVLVRNRNADCLRCAEVCTSECITFDGEDLVLHPDNCIGCGTCATVCPTCALEAHYPDDAELLQACQKAISQSEKGFSRVTIACKKLLDRAEGMFDVEKIVRVECLGRVEESLLTELAAEGVTHVYLAYDDCKSCEHVHGRAMLEKVIATENILLDTWEKPIVMKASDKLPGYTRATDKGYDASRRQFFSKSAKEIKRLGSAAVKTSLPIPENEEEAEPPRYAKVGEDGTLPHFLPTRRGRILSSLAHIGKPKDVTVNTRLWGEVELDVDKCASCLMCAVFCPTGALQKFEHYEDDGKKHKMGEVIAPKELGVMHYPGACVKCHSCEVICPEGAITIHDEVHAADMLRGLTNTFYMNPSPNIQKGKTHGILNVNKKLMKIDEVYER